MEKRLIHCEPTAATNNQTAEILLAGQGPLDYPTPFVAKHAAISWCCPSSIQAHTRGQHNAPLSQPVLRTSVRSSQAFAWRGEPSGDAAGRFLRGTMRSSTTTNGFVVGMPGEFLDQGLDVPPLRLGQRTGLRHRPSLGPADPAVSVVSQNRTILFAKGLY